MDCWEKCLLLFSRLWLLWVPSEKSRKCDLFVQGSFVLKVLDSGTLERSRNKKKKIVKMNKTHFPVLCTLIRLHYMFSDPWSSVTFDSFNRNIFDSVNANSSSQVSWKMQFAKNRVLQAIQFSINSFPSSQSLMSFSADLRARANQNLIHIFINVYTISSVYGMYVYVHAICITKNQYPTNNGILIVDANIYIQMSVNQKKKILLVLLSFFLSIGRVHVVCAYNVGVISDY